MLDTIRGMTRLFTTDDGLPNNNVMSILPDESGSLWLSTDRGLSRFHPEHKSFVNYDVHDGLPHNEFNRMAALKSSNGRLYFGSLNGVTSFNPGEVDASLDQLMPLLTHYSYYQGTTRYFAHPRIYLSRPALPIQLHAALLQATGKKPLSLYARRLG